MTAFVGPSGSGKSTIAKLIGGFWDVDKGKITLGGQDLKEIPLSQLYDQVAFVSQDNYLFDETVRENIRMGKPGASDAEVETVAKAAGCDGFIRGLENGYDTVGSHKGGHTACRDGKGYVVQDLLVVVVAEGNVLHLNIHGVQLYHVIAVVLFFAV